MVFNYEELEIVNPDDMSNVLSAYKSHVRTKSYLLHLEFLPGDGENSPILYQGYKRFILGSTSGITQNDASMVPSL